MTAESAHKAHGMEFFNGPSSSHSKLFRKTTWSSLGSCLALALPQGFIPSSTGQFQSTLKIQNSPDLFACCLSNVPFPHLFLQTPLTSSDPEPAHHSQLNKLYLICLTCPLYLSCRLKTMFLEGSWGWVAHRIVWFLICFSSFFFCSNVSVPRYLQEKHPVNKGYARESPPLCVWNIRYILLSLPPLLL